MCLDVGTIVYSLRCMGENCLILIGENIAVGRGVSCARNKRSFGSLSDTRKYIERYKLCRLDRY